MGRLSIWAILLGFLTTVGLGALLATIAQGISGALSQRWVTGAAPLIATVVIVTVSYVAGGYVAGRAAGRAGGRHGLGVWIAAVLLTLVLGALADVAGADISVAERFGLPQVKTRGSPASGGALAVSLLVVLAPLLAAVIGGKAATGALPSGRSRMRLRPTRA